MLTLTGGVLRFAAQMFATDEIVLVSHKECSAAYTYG